MADSSDSDLPDLAELEAFNAQGEEGSEDESGDGSSEYDSAQEEVEDDGQDGEYDMEEVPTPEQLEASESQSPADPAAPAQPPEEYYGYPPPEGFPVAFKRRYPSGRPPLTPHERARREAARMLKKAEERAKRTIRRHETTYTKARKAEVCLYLLMERVELVGEARAMRMREGITIGGPERMPGPGEELVRYRPVNFDDASTKWRIPVSTIQAWWKKRDKILGKDHPELHKPRSYFEVIPMRPESERPQLPKVPVVPVVVPERPPPPPPVTRYQRSNVVHLGPPPGVQAYLWELGL